MRTTLFWVITQDLVIIPYRRFRTIYRFHLQGSRIQEHYSINIKRENGLTLCGSWRPIIRVLRGSRRPSQ